MEEGGGSRGIGRGRVRRGVRKGVESALRGSGVVRKRREESGRRK